MPLAQDDGGGGGHSHSGADITSGTVADARLSSKAVLDDSTHTLTNKTYDANATGNVLSNIESADISGSAAITKAQISDTGTWTIAEIPDTAKKQAIIIALGDESTAVTVADSVVEFRMPYAFTLDEVRATLTLAGGTSGTTTIDIEEAGSTILSTLITIDQGEFTSEDAATAPVISDTALADDALISLNVDAVTGDADEAGLKVILIGQRA